MKSTTPVKIWNVTQQQRIEKSDFLAVEEPVEIRLGLYEKESKSISITMRTPGNDFELAIGFLFTEGIIQSKDQIKNIDYAKVWEPEKEENIVLVEIVEGVEIDFLRLERHFYTSSSCGVCGKASIDAVKFSGMKEIPQKHPVFDHKLIHSLPDLLREKQAVFDDTGGLHAAALFDNSGKLHLLREDVGRHNAVDKLIGAALLNDMTPLHDFLIMVSGRASFELIQKSLMAGIPLLAAVGAPSSLAISLAEEAGMTVMGFVRDGRFNIYSGAERIS
jgi:FdhD protein